MAPATNLGCGEAHLGRIETQVTQSRSDSENRLLALLFDEVTIARHIFFWVVDGCDFGRKNHFNTSPIETIPIMLVPSTTGRCRTRFSVITRIHLVMLSLGVAVNNSRVMISLTGVSFEKRPFRITFRA